MDWYNMAYKYINKEIEPVQLTDGFIFSISLSQFLDTFTEKWIVDITFNIFDTNDDEWNLLMRISMNEYKEFYVNNVLDFLTYNKELYSKLSIKSFGQELANLTSSSLSKSKLIENFTAKNPKLKKR